ncbi:unnamed protein product [Urochloa humidicola]
MDGRAKLAPAMDLRPHGPHPHWPWKALTELALAGHGRPARSSALPWISITWSSPPPTMDDHAEVALAGQVALVLIDDFGFAGEPELTEEPYYAEEDHFEKEPNNSACEYAGSDSEHEFNHDGWYD